MIAMYGEKVAVDIEVAELNRRLAEAQIKRAGQWIVARAPRTWHVGKVPELAAPFLTARGAYDQAVRRKREAWAAYCAAPATLETLNAWRAAVADEWATEKALQRHQRDAENTQRAHVAWGCPAASEPAYGHEMKQWPEVPGVNEAPLPAIRILRQVTATAALSVLPRVKDFLRARQDGMPALAESIRARLWEDGFAIDTNDPKYGATVGLRCVAGRESRV